MKTILRFTTVLALLCTAAVSFAQAPQNVRIRATITAIDGDVLSLNSREGTAMKVRMTEKTTVATARGLKLVDLPKNAFIGITAVKGPDGVLVARGLHMIPKTANEGHTQSDFEPGASMTNAYLEANVQTSSGGDLTVVYKDGMQRVRVPIGTPVVAFDPADRSALAPGVYVIVAAQVGPDNTITALRIQAEKAGVKPPQ
ncbi:MAG: DUF5666 domain-containing protein [bacterium]|jgi:hypothetical protein|nr:DUF5666 domain-containing protein [Betaproteobacteria bacterium]